MCGCTLEPLYEERNGHLVQPSNVDMMAYKLLVQRCESLEKRLTLYELNLEKTKKEMFDDIYESVGRMVEGKKTRRSPSKGSISKRKTTTDNLEHMEKGK